MAATDPSLAQPSTEDTPMETDDAPPAADNDTQQEQQQDPEARVEAETEEHAEAPPESPPLQRHTPVAPGPRATRLLQLYEHSLKRTLGKLKWDNFAACYPTVAKRAEPVLKQVQAQMVDKLGEKCEKEFEAIMLQRQVVPKINQLETLISDASHRRTTSSGPDPTPPHLLPASSILSAHLTPSLTSHQSHLNARLQTSQSHNAILHEQILLQRSEIDSLLQALEAAIGDVHSANAALGPIVQQLAAESRQADVDVLTAESGGGDDGR